jgi:hypothetical protein
VYLIRQLCIMIRSILKERLGFLSRAGFKAHTFVEDETRFLGCPVRTWCCTTRTQMPPYFLHHR